MSRSTLALLAFAALTVVVATGFVRGLDASLFDLAQRPHERWLDLVASLVSLGGDAAVTAGIALGLVVARLRAGRRDASLPLAIAVTVLIELALKLVVAQPAPPHELSRTIAILPTPQADFPFSFPSGHLARSAFLLFVTSAPRALTTLGLVVMALTRVYLAEHWPSDVLGGALLGMAVADLARSIHSRR